MHGSRLPFEFMKRHDVPFCHPQQRPMLSGTAVTLGPWHLVQLGELRDPPCKADRWPTWIRF